MTTGDRLTLKKKRKLDKITKLTVINTNARSLCPKIDCLVDCMEEKDAGLAVIMETWLGGGMYWMRMS